MSALEGRNGEVRYLQLCVRAKCVDYHNWAVI